MRFTHHAKLLALGAALAGLVIVPGVGEVSTATSEPSCGPINAEGFHEISTASQMASIISGSGCGVDKNYILLDDIKLSGSWTPIGSLEDTFEPFTGVFDGNGKTVTGLEYDGDGWLWVGLFGAIGSTGEVKNLILSSVDLRSTREGSALGGLVGENLGTIANVVVTGQVIGDNTTGKTTISLSSGGLAGINRGTITGSSADVTVTGQNRAGGLVGFSTGTTSRIVNSQASGDVTAANLPPNGAGGLVGSAQDTEILRSSASGEVKNGWYVGGLLGSAIDVTVRETLAVGNITAGDAGGGLIGRARGANIFDSYSWGDVTTTTTAGGLIGSWENLTSVARVYSLGKASAGTRSGGLVGFFHSGFEIGAFWSTTPAGQAPDERGTPKTDSELQQIATFESVWPIVAGGATSAPEPTEYTPWAIGPDAINGGFPYLLWETCGPLSSGGFHDISSANQLRNVGTGGTGEGVCGLSAKYLLVAEVNLSTEANWVPIGSEAAPFAGQFEGNSNDPSDPGIVGLSDMEDGHKDIGLFGALGSTAVIRDLFLINFTVKPKEEVDTVGALAGRSAGTIDNVFLLSSTVDNDGKKVGDTSVTPNQGGIGGLVGEVSGIVRNSQVEGTSVFGAPPSGANSGNSATATGGMVGHAAATSVLEGVAFVGGEVRGFNLTGGLVGFGFGVSISEGLVSGDVSGNATVGGLIGFARGADISESSAGGNVAGLLIVGGFVGENRETSFIDGSSFTGGVNVPGGAQIVGGFVGSNSLNSSISHSSSTAVINVDGEGVSVGGFVGSNENTGRISNSGSAGSVSTKNATTTGGFAGENKLNSEIAKATTSTSLDIDGNSTWVGGFVGQNQLDAVVSQSFSTGSLEISGSTNSTGGFVGVNQNAGEVIDSYAAGDLSIAGNALWSGGFAGTNQLDGVIRTSLTRSRVQVAGSLTTVGGFTGLNQLNADVVASFWRTDSSTFSTSPAGVGVTTANLQRFETYTDAGWSIADCSAEGSPTVWGFQDGAFPFLTWQDDPQLAECPAPVGPSTQTAPPGGSSPPPAPQTVTPGQDSVAPGASSLPLAPVTGLSGEAQATDEPEGRVSPEATDGTDGSTGDATAGDTASGGADADTDVAATPQGGANTGWLLGIALGGLAAIALIAGGVMFARTRL